MTSRLHALVEYIQSNYPPAGKLPDFDEFTIDKAGQLKTPLDFPQRLEPAKRPGIPEWLQHPDVGILLPPNYELSVGEAPSPTHQEAPDTASEQLRNPDVLAYYLPFHFYRRKWGIYLLESGVLSIAKVLAKSGTPTGNTLRLARTILIEHEMFHFLTEAACSYAEVAAKQSLYPAYFLDSYAIPLEEALSNARAIRQTFRGKDASLRDLIETWMHSQGPGYCDFHHWLATYKFSRGRHLATLRMLLPIKGHTGREPSEFLYAGTVGFKPPMYLVQDAGILDLLKPFPNQGGIRVLVHSIEHPPPHVHVQMTPGQDTTRLEWPSLKTYKGDYSLSKKQRRKLDSYLALYGAQIEKRVTVVFGTGHR